MKRSNHIKSIIFCILWTLIIIAVPYFIMLQKEYDIKNNKNYISSSYEIYNYEVTLDVNYNNKIDVTENFNVNVSNDEYKGIYKSIPLYMRYNEDGKLKSKKAIVSNVRSIGEKFYKTENLNNVLLNIGSERTNLEQGLHEYVIKYRYDLGKDDYKNKDMFIFNVFEHFDNTSISSMVVNINMPFEFEEKKIKFYNSNIDITENIKYEINDKQIIIKMNKHELNGNVTIFLELEDNYFKGERSNYSFKSFCISIILIVTSIIVILLWIKHGKDNEKRLKTVEFRSPDNLDPLIVGYIYGEDDIKKLTTSLIISLASKKFIKIEEISKDKYKLIKLLGNLKELSINELIVYKQLFINGNENIISEDNDFAAVYGRLEKSIKNYVSKNINEVFSSKLMNLTTILLIISVILWTISYVYIKDLNPIYNNLYLLSFLSILITGFFSIIMDRKTLYGEVIYSRIKGFKDYLVLCELKDLEKNVDNMNEYFYEILPYTYALSVSNEWMEKFNKKNLPNIKLKNHYLNDTFMIL